MRYHGEGLFQWDTWYLVDPDETVHGFYLQQRRPGSERSGRDADSIGHATSRDLLTWTEQPPAVPPAEPGEPGDLVNWTGSTVEHEGVAHLVYTIRSSATDGREQAIGLATSTDRQTWTKHPDNPVLEPDPRWYNSRERPAAHGIVDCRDLMIVKHPSRPGWFGVFATRVITTDPAVTELPEGAAFGGAYSEDLVHWEQTPPVFRSPDDRYSIVEMPDLFELDGRWYLTFLEDNAYGNRDVLGDRRLTCGTRYAVADRVEGPYVEPADNLLLASTGFNGISCRTLRHRGRLYVLYTSCERELENETKQTFGVLSLPKEVRIVDGRLRFCFADLIMDRAELALIEPGRPAEIVPVHSTHETWGRWEAGNDGWRGSARTAWARQSFAPVAGDFVASVRVRLDRGVAAGLLIRQSGSRGAVALLDVEHQEVVLATVPRFQVVDVRPWPLQHGRTYLLRVIGNGEFVEVYLDEELVLQCVWYGAREGRLGLLVDRGEATFTDLTAHALWT